MVALLLDLENLMHTSFVMKHTRCYLVLIASRY